MSLLTSLAIYAAAWLVFALIIYLIKRDVVKGFILIMWRSERLTRIVRHVSERLSFVPLKAYSIAAIALFISTYLPLPLPSANGVFFMPSYILTLFGSMGRAASSAVSGAPIQEVANAGGQAAVMPVLPGITIPWGHLPYMAVAVAIAVIIHEFAHGYAAVRYGIKLKSAGAFSMFFIISGAFVEPDDVEFKRSPLLAKAVVMASGVAANAALAMGVLTVYVASIYLSSQMNNVELIRLLTEPSFMKFVMWIFIVNMGLAVINSLPIYPLDGGLLLTALLGRLMGERRAQMTAYAMSLVLVTLIAMSSTFGLMSGVYRQILQIFD